MIDDINVQIELNPFWLLILLITVVRDFCEQIMALVCIPGIVHEGQNTEQTKD